jgi:hypothetical protein
VSKHNSSHFFIENWQCFIDFYVFWGQRINKNTKISISRSTGVSAAVPKATDDLWDAQMQQVFCLV